MTKTRTLRESSKYLSDRYKFKRTLGTNTGVKRSFSERNERINRVSPVKDILIYEPQVMPSTPPSSDVATDAVPQVRITKENTNWPFRIEYIEQILDVSELWVVVADGRSPQASYRYSSGAASTHTPISGINLDLIKIEKPYVVKGEVRPIGEGRRALNTEQELRHLEDPYRPNSWITRGIESVWIQGRRPDQCVDIYLCNILPHNLTLYNCTFYERDVAHLYMESLSEYIKRFTDTQSPPNH